MRPIHFLRAIPVLLISLITNSGCKSVEPLPTQSGQPEVTLAANTSVDAVKAVAEQFFHDRGYIDTPSRHTYEMVFDKADPERKAGKALRIRLRISQQLNHTWVLRGSPLIVEGWRTDLETDSFAPYGMVQVQGFLDEIKARVEAGQ